MIIALDFVEAGRVIFEVFEPIRGESRGRNDESWALSARAAEFQPDQPLQLNLKLGATAGSPGGG